MNIFFRILKNTTRPCAPPTTKELEVTASPLTIFLVVAIDGKFARYASPGFVLLFKISFVTVDNTELNNVTPKILKMIVKPKKKSPSNGEKFYVIKITGNI